MTGESIGPESPKPTLFDLLARTQTEEIPSAVWPGMTLNWDSPFIDIQLHAELPFWLMMPDGDLTVSFQDCSLNASIIGTAIEIQYGRAFRTSRSSVEHFEKASVPSEKAQAVIRAAKDGFVLRQTRSIITLHTRALEDCSNAVDESGRRSVDATMYFRCLATAHFPFVNSIINAYRKSTTDPFAMEVTEWDVPVWFLSIGDRFRRISLMPYADIEGFPQMFKDGSSQPIHLSTMEEVQAALKAGEVPGDSDLLDAWALYYRGRYGDAIRYLVTAIEVVLEYKLRDALAQKDLGDDEIEQRLERTLNDFERRLADYVRVTGRRIPGPLISVIPWINGVRLKQELDSARQLRHKVVHESLRLERSMKGYLQRPMETMSWLFNWFRTESPIKVTGLGNGYILKMSLLAHLDFFLPSTRRTG
ncbi:MAG: hypothetical protein ACLQJ7_10440 [Syntrophobacteraceae bacterium]